MKPPGKPDLASCAPSLPCKILHGPCTCTSAQMRVHYIHLWLHRWCVWRARCYQAPHPPSFPAPHFSYLTSQQNTGSKFHAGSAGEWQACPVPAAPRTTPPHGSCSVLPAPPCCAPRRGVCRLLESHCSRARHTRTVVSAGHVASRHGSRRRFRCWLAGGRRVGFSRAARATAAARKAVTASPASEPPKLSRRIRDGSAPDAPLTERARRRRAARVAACTLVMCALCHGDAQGSLFCPCHMQQLVDSQVVLRMCSDAHGAIKKRTSRLVANLVRSSEGLSPELSPVLPAMPECPCSADAAGEYGPPTLEAPPLAAAASPSSANPSCDGGGRSRCELCCEELW